MGFAYIVKDSVPCFVCHMTEKIFFLYLTGFQNFQGTVCGSFGMLWVIWPLCLLLLMLPCLRSSWSLTRALCLATVSWLSMTS